LSRIVSPASALTSICPLLRRLSLIWCKELATETGITTNQAKALQNGIAAVQNT